MNPKEKNRPRKHRSTVVEEIKRNTDPLAAARSKKKLIIASKIAEALDKGHMKRIDLAQLMGKEPSEVTRWTRGDHNFTVDILSDLEEVLGLQILPTRLAGGVKLHHELECSLTINIEPKAGRKISKQDINNVATYIAECGGMQVTELRGFAKTNG